MVVRVLEWNWRWRRFACPSFPEDKCVPLRKEGEHHRKSTSFLFALLTVLCAPPPAALAEGTRSVIQFATHPSLDNCYSGFWRAWAGLHIDFQNATADMSMSDLQAKTMVSQGVKMLVGIATPAAMSAYAAARDAGTPVVFVAVSDPVAAGIVQSIEAPGGNCTGVSDVLNFAAQLEMIRAFLPEAKTIGVIYTTGEPNSVSHLASFQALAGEYGFSVEAVGITGPSEWARRVIPRGRRASPPEQLHETTSWKPCRRCCTPLRRRRASRVRLRGGAGGERLPGGPGIDYVALGRQAARWRRDPHRESRPGHHAVLQVSEVTPAITRRSQKPSYNCRRPRDVGIADVAK